MAGEAEGEAGRWWESTIAAQWAPQALCSTGIAGRLTSGSPWNYSASGRGPFLVSV